MFARHHVPNKALVVFEFGQSLHRAHQNVVVAKEFIEQKPTEPITEALVFRRICKRKRREVKCACVQAQSSQITNQKAIKLFQQKKIHVPSVTSFTEMLSRCRVFGDNRRKPYSSAYSTIYFSSGKTVERGMTDSKWSIRDLCKEIIVGDQHQ